MAWSSREGYPEQTAPTVAAPSGFVLPYAKADGLLYSMDDAGVERLLTHAVETLPVGKVITGTYTGTFRTYLNGNYTFESIEVGSDVAIAGQALIFDVLKNGTTIWSTGTNRPTIAVAGFRATMAGAPSTLTFANGDYLTFSVPQVGTNAQVNLQALLRLRRTG